MLIKSLLWTFLLSMNNKDGSIYINEYVKSRPAWTSTELSLFELVTGQATALIHIILAVEDTKGSPFFKCIVSICFTLHLEISIFQTIWKRIWVLSLFRQGTKSWRLSHHSSSENTTFPHQVLHMYGTKKNLSVKASWEILFKYFAFNCPNDGLHLIMWSNHINCVWDEIIFLY